MTYDSFIKNNRVTDFNALLPVQHEASFRFAEWNICVNIGDKKIYSNLRLKELVDIDKNEWEYFWHLFNLYQTTDNVDNTFEGDEGVDELAGPELLK